MNCKFCPTVTFLMSRIGILKATGQCNSAEYSFGGMYLRGLTFRTCRVGLPEECYFKCQEEITCQSYNFVIGQNICELNNRTKQARPEDFLPDRKRFYMKRLGNRVPIGSKELPAESCSEIKVSEGNEMVNGKNKFWLYYDGNGELIESYCEDELLQELERQRCAKIEAERKLEDKLEARGEIQNFVHNFLENPSQEAPRHRHSEEEPEELNVVEVLKEEQMVAT